MPSEQMVIVQVLLQRFQSALLCRAPELNAGGLARVSWALASMGVAEGCSWAHAMLSHHIDIWLI